MIDTIILEPLLNLLLFLYAVIPGGFGVAIIAMTIVIRLATWPLMKKQVHKQEEMKELQKKQQELKPRIDKIKKQAKGDKQKEARMLSELYREQGINPMAMLGSMGPMLLQLPILIALVEVFRDMITVEQIKTSAYSFVNSLPAIQDILAQPDAFDPMLLGVFRLSETSLILAAVAGVTTYVTARQMSAQKSSQSDSGKTTGAGLLMKVMPIAVFGISATFPAALPLYIATMSLVATFQQHIILKEEENVIKQFMNRRKGAQGSSEASSPEQTSSSPEENKSKHKAQENSKKPQQSSDDATSGQQAASGKLQAKTKKG